MNDPSFASNDDAFVEMVMYSKSKKLEVKISILKPFYVYDSDDYRCDYNIIGMNVNGFAYGIDSLQSMLIAMKKISSIIYTSDLYKNQDLMYLDHVVHDLGLPFSRSIQDLIRPIDHL